MHAPDNHQLLPSIEEEIVHLVQSEQKDASIELAQSTAQHNRPAIVSLIALITILLLSFIAISSKLRHTSLSNVQWGKPVPVLINQLFGTKPQSMSEDERLLLYGDTDAPSSRDQWKAAHELDPTDPKLFFRYARAKIEETGSLSAQDWECINTYDPNNGIYELALASYRVDHAIEKIKPQNRFMDKQSELPERTQIKINNPEALTSILDLIRQAQQKGVLNDHFHAFTDLYNQILGPPQSYAQTVTRVTVFSLHHSTGTIYLQTAYALAAAIQQAEQREDWAEISALWEIYAWLIAEQLKEHETLIESLVAKACMRSMAVEFYYATRKHPDTTLRQQAEAYFQKEREYREFRRNRREARKRGEQRCSEENIAHQADILSNIAIPAYHAAIQTRPTFDSTLLVNAQRMEQACRLSNGMIPLTLILLSIAACILYAIQQSCLPTLRNLGHQIGQSAALSRCTLVLLLSSVLPIVALLLARYCLSFGALDYGYGIMQVPGLPHQNHVFIYALLAILYSPFAFGALASPFSHRAWYRPLLLALIYIGLFTSFLATPDFLHRSWSYISSGLLVVIALSLLWLALRPSHRQLRSKVLLRGTLHTILPCYALSSLLLILVGYALQLEEKHWATQPNNLNANQASSTVIEDQVCEILNQENILWMKD